MGVGVGTQGELIPLSAADYRSRLGSNPSTPTTSGENMKTELVTDLPMGILLMVISQFFLFGVITLINTNQWYTVVGTVVCSVIYWRFFQTGFRVAFLGIEVDVEEQ
jgi:hypothetical protein